MENSTASPSYNTTLPSYNTTSPPYYTTLPSCWLEPHGLTIFRLIFAVTIALAGIIGNILVCVVTTTSLTSKKPTNTFLLSLAIADLGVLLFNFPIAISKERSPSKYIWGEFFCLYIAPATETLFCASIWSITAIAVDRYRNIIGANRLRRTTLKTSRCTIVAIWIASFIVASLPLYAITVYENGQCIPVWPQIQGRDITMPAYTTILAVVWYVLPLVIISFTYLRIRQKVSQSIRFREAMRQEMKGRMQDIQRRQLRDNEKTRRILSPLVILFAITMIPITALRLVVAFPAQISLECFFVGYNVATICIVINSSLNPILYYIVSNEFRLAYQIIINRLCKSCWKPFRVGLEKRWHSRGNTTRLVETTEKGSQKLMFKHSENNDQGPFQIISAV